MPSQATGRPLAASSRARTLAAVSSWYDYLLSLDEDLVGRLLGRFISSIEADQTTIIATTSPTAVSTIPSKPLSKRPRATNDPATVSTQSNLRGNCSKVTNSLTNCLLHQLLSIRDPEVMRSEGSSDRVPIIVIAAVRHSVD